MGAHARAMPSSSSSDWQLGHVPVDQLAAAISQVSFVPILGQPPRSGPPPPAPTIRPDALVANATSAALAANPHALAAGPVARLANATVAGLTADFAFADFAYEADFSDMDFEDTGKGKKRKSSAAGGGLHIVVETGAWEDIWDFQVQEDDKIIDVKNQIWNVMGGPSDGAVVLSYEGTILIDNFTLRDYEVKNNSRFYLTWADDDDV